MQARLKVLIVEDNPMIAVMTEELLEASHYQVCGVASAAGAAMALARIDKPDIAMIDLRLANDESGIDVAASLRTLGRIGILYTTGSPALAGFAGAVGEARLAKPYPHCDLLRALDLVAEIVATGKRLRRFPRVFEDFAKARSDGHGV